MTEAVMLIGRSVCSSSSSEDGSCDCPSSGVAAASFFAVAMADWGALLCDGDEADDCL
jgi:hypothetical protein